MAEEAHYSSATADTPSMKRKYDDEASPQSTTHRRTTGFSNAPLASPPSDSAPSYKNVPPPVDDFQIAKQKAQEIAARLLLNANPADVKRPRVDSNNGGGYESNDKFSGGGYSSSFSDVGYKSSSAPSYGGSYGFQGSSKKIDIPNGRVGVIIGKGGETIKYLQLQSGAKIQVTRDAESDPNSPNRLVELTGTPDQIAKAEQLITEVLSQADAGGSNQMSRRMPGQSGGEQFSMKVPNNKVGLVIGKGGETIKNMQATTGARIQVIPLHLPPGDTSMERTVQIDGTNDQIEHAKQLVNEVISENRARNPSMGGGNPQGYGARPQGNWGQSGGPPMQQQGYGGYMQPVAYPGSAPHYNMPQGPYGGYPPQPASGGYPSGWDQSSASQGQQGSGYDYYGQHATQQQQPQGASGSSDSTAYNYNQQPAGYGQQSQGYPQGSYGGYPAPQPGYDTANPHPGYDQQQGYNAAAYGSGTNTNPEANTQSYGAQADASSTAPAPPASVGQQGYTANPNQQPSPNSANYASQASAPQTGYGVPPPSQPAYGGSQAPMQPGYGSGYGPPQGQKPLTAAPVYGQTQQSPNAQGGNYAQPGYPPTQPPPAQAGYAQADPSAQRAPTSSYGTPAAPASQPGYGQPSYNAPPNAQSAYGQQPPPYNGSYGSGYPQASAYPADASSGAGSTCGAYEASSTTQAAAPQSGKASPSS